MKGIFGQKYLFSLGLFFLGAIEGNNLEDFCLCKSFWGDKEPWSIFYSNSLQKIHPIEQTFFFRSSPYYSYNVKNNLDEI